MPSAKPLARVPGGTISTVKTLTVPDKVGIAAVFCIAHELALERAIRITFVGKTQDLPY